MSFSQQMGHLMTDLNQTGKELGVYTRFILKQSFPH